MLHFRCPACGEPYRPGGQGNDLGAACAACGLPFLLERSRAAELGRETVRILESGRYTTPSGGLVDIGETLRRAVEGTHTYPPEESLPALLHGGRHTSIAVTNETTLTAARRLRGEGHVAALNFAAATNPGGGFLSGSRAQEESLARSSGLYACLAGNPMYDFHRGHGDPLYTDYVIYSPEVPVFRTDDGTLLETPWTCSFLTSPAVHARAVLRRDPSRRGEIREAMRSRIRKVLTVPLCYSHDTLVLGAWGCGAFGNDADEVAELFREALAGPLAGAFQRVVFAVTDWSAERRFIGPFAQAFGGERAGSSGV